MASWECSVNWMVSPEKWSTTDQVSGRDGLKEPTTVALTRTEVLMLNVSALTSSGRYENTCTRQRFLEE